MVDVSGHVGMALLFAAPAWVLWDRRGALGFAAFALAASMLPDADLALRHVLPVAHHGVTHTLAFVALASVLGGAAASRWLTPRLDASRWVRSAAIPRGTVFVFAAAGLLAGGVSHVFADVLSAPDVAAPLSPFWPVYPEPVVVDVLYYDSPVWNFGLLAVAVALHLLLARYGGYPVETRYRTGDRDGGEPSAAND